jgi:hypothetical protein
MFVLNMAKQEVFDTVVNHLFKQGKQALRQSKCGDSICVYRAEDGSKCAFGCLIPDSEYNSKMEEKVVHQLLSIGYIEIPNDNVRQLCEKLQQIHDSWDTSDGPFHTYLDVEFADIAERYDLTYTKRK